MLLREPSLLGIKNLQHCIRCSKEMDEFLAYDFSKPIQKKQEKKILDWLKIFSEMDVGLLEKNIVRAFKYYSQINAILANKSNSDAFKKNVNEYCKIFKKERLDYFQGCKLQDKSHDCIVLAVFGAMFSDINRFYLFEKDIKFELEVNAKKICEQSKSSLYEYFSLNLGGVAKKSLYKQRNRV